MPHTVTPFFSLIIPTLNEEKYLPRLLQDLTQQIFTNFEVIHVDGTSDDNTLQVARKFAAKLHLISLTTRTRNVGRQRNLGGKKAKGKWIVFCDADDQLQKTFLQHLANQLDNSPQTDFFTCWMDPDKSRLSHQVFAWFMNMTISFNKFIKNYYAIGALIGARASIFPSNQFDESIPVLEDSLFVRELYKKGYHYTVFRHPRYIFSLRRIRKDGLLKSIIVAIKMQQKFLSGVKITTDTMYPMHGGKTYEKM